MRLFHTALAAAAAILLTTASANAVVVAAGPSAVDPNFNATATSSMLYYGMEAWGGTKDTSSPYYTNNPSFIGSTPFDPGNQWNNGDPGTSPGKVGFISGNGGYAEQAINGFTVGESYSISLLTNSRIGVSQSALTISYSPVATETSIVLRAQVPAGSTTIYSAAVPVANTLTNQTGAFTSVTSAAFVATTSTELVRLTNSGGTDSSVLMTGFRVNSLGLVPVPEPVSMALLATGLLGLGLARRRP